MKKTWIWVIVNTHDQRLGESSPQELLFFGERIPCVFRQRKLVKHLRIKISDKSLTQRFDVSMTSLSSEKIKYRLVNIYKMRC